MSFTSPDFALFLPIVFGVWLVLRGHYAPTLAWLLAASLVFYGHRHWQILPIIVGYWLVDWLTGIALSRTQWRRLVLSLGIGFNLALLSFWKYTPLVLATVAATVGLSDIGLQRIAAGSWAIPLGISFFSFTGIAYMVDVYRGTIRPERNVWRYGLFTSFFPHLVAGPILRAHEFLADLGPNTLPRRSLAPTEGAILIARGFFKKLVLADGIARAIDPFFAHVADATTAGVWSLPYVYLYALQIYFDFSGYTDIARGLGLWFGFRWPENFARPYLATSIQEFWRRWHMTLSRFLRDYLYIPLGGSRHGPWREAFAVMVTMLLGGLWHGASWSFMLWGALHGTFLLINRAWDHTGLCHRLAALSGATATAWRGLRIVLTFHAVCLAWCFFRLTQLPDSIACLRKWVAFDLDKAVSGGAADPGLWMLLALYGLASLAAHRLTNGSPLPEAVERFTTRPVADGMLWGGAIGLVALAVLLSPGGSAPFIYFQF